ncbi:MAG: S-adenosylmethionine:tRNA ribosyltransferase-isomerase [Sediminibacterium sp.]|nr:S-adenosylmethionine:tRNA ribosyltransferase-isomerase [Sediminibacterium sp.]
MHPKDLSILDFTYDLPASKIASYPLEQRDASKLLVYGAGTGAENVGASANGAGAAQISETTYSKLDEVLPSNTLLVHNDTKVVAARLFFEKENGTVIEIFCLEPASIYKDITTAMLAKKQVLWGCLIGGAKKWKEGSLHIKYGNNYTLTATKHSTLADSFLIQFEWDNEAQSFAEVLEAAGNIPLPPYFNRAVEANDKERYQTVYAAAEGSVAAPTAGLHFTPALFDKLAAKNITKEFVTLHVGAGTFKPVKAARMEEHEMHAEYIDVQKSFIEMLRDNASAKTIIAVGTTSLRTLESLYWMGAKIIAANKTHNNKQANELANPSIENISVVQWDPYELMPQNELPSTTTALTALCNWMEQNSLSRLIARTQIIIAPGYRFKIIDGLITNFHQPQSTLLLLVAAITHGKWKPMYDYALENNFRFLSYGDGCLIWLDPSAR